MYARMCGRAVCMHGRTRCCVRRATSYVFVFCHNDVRVHTRTHSQVVHLSDDDITVGALRAASGEGGDNDDNGGGNGAADDAADGAEGWRWSGVAAGSLREAWTGAARLGWVGDTATGTGALLEPLLTVARACTRERPKALASLERLLQHQ